MFLSRVNFDGRRKLCFAGVVRVGDGGPGSARSWRRAGVRRQITRVLPEPLSSVGFVRSGLASLESALSVSLANSMCAIIQATVLSLSSLKVYPCQIS